MPRTRGVPGGGGGGGGGRGGKKVGVALDFCATSKAALTWAMDMIEPLDTLILIHVLPASLIDKSQYSSSLLQLGAPMLRLFEFKNPDVMKAYYLKPDKEVLDMLDAVTSQKDAYVRTKLYWGDAREKLCQAVKDLNLDSIVMANRGLGPLPGILLGSVSNYMVTNAPCPVTIVKDAAPLITQEISFLC